jgi:hypothetical protein
MLPSALLLSRWHRLEPVEELPLRHGGGKDSFTRVTVTSFPVCVP